MSSDMRVLLKNHKQKKKTKERKGKNLKKTDNINKTLSFTLQEKSFKN